MEQSRSNHQDILKLNNPIGLVIVIVTPWFLGCWLSKSLSKLQTTMRLRKSWQQHKKDTDRRTKYQSLGLTLLSSLFYLFGFVSDFAGKIKLPFHFKLQCVSRHPASGIGLVWACFETDRVPKRLRIKFRQRSLIVREEASSIFNLS